MYLDYREKSEYDRTSRYRIGLGMKMPPAPKEGAQAKAPVQMLIQCDGCLGGGQVSAHVPKCAMRECAAAKSKTRRCSDCSEFPCSVITDFNNDGVQHHAVLLENLRQLRAIGITEWAKYEDDRWRCSKCRTMFSWYDSECPRCKAPRPDKLFPLKKT